MDIRSLFPGANRRVFLDSAGIGLVGAPAGQAIRDFVDLAEQDPRAAHHGPSHVAAREAAARMVGSKPDNIALVTSTTLAMNIAADAVPLAAGDNVVTTDLEFMSVIVPWFEKCRDQRAELRVARHGDGVIDPQSVIDLIDSKTRTVVLSAVQWTNGYRIDLSGIGRECSKRGVPLIVDGIQQMGVIPFDIERSHVDFLGCGGHKWLGSPSGLGFAYVSEDFAKRFKPTLSYVPTSVPPDDSWQTSWTSPSYDPIRTYALRPTAARFESGAHHGGLGAAGLAAALELLIGADMAAGAAHVTRLANRVAKGVASLGYKVVSPLKDEMRSGITVFTTRTPPVGDLAVQKALRDEGVDVSVRYTSGIGGVRVSTHVYNDDGDVDKFLAALSEIGNPA